ncbi:MAG: heavy-metal-associated domain-containing protein [Lunatimonas sp.]|uniref:heavy-metal-associated domain-containing protein n=1 Tax=Lunatimonas sp. TaxID=2060141 RepID=UPI00263B91BC|nr:heavy-metal-associated domain-containing protein [Lunatimonas sp.]MCC5939375.1 heavy-metal-associated domain-containing protein [Lunatimonas sp.]
MMIKRIVIGALVLAGVLVVVLAMHIYMVTASEGQKGPVFAMGKFIFEQELDAEAQAAFSSVFKKQEGIKDVRINRDAGFFICLYDQKKWSTEAIIQSVQEHFQVSAYRYHPSTEELASSCPAFSKDSFIYRLGGFFENLFAKR